MLARQPVANARLAMVALARLPPNVLARRAAVAYPPTWAPAPLLIRQRRDPCLFDQQLFVKFKLLDGARRRALVV